MSRLRKNHRGHSILFLSLLVVVVIALVFIGAYKLAEPKYKQPAAKPTASKTVVATQTAASIACKGNNLAELVVVSISARHMWACSYTSSVYDSPVITGMDFLAADLTPTGIYQIYAKETDVYLKGSDSTGSWDDYVYYWMPFLSNQYGVYGFHDATWRAANAFGNISPNSNQASHGCVEMPLATAKWLYNWASIGTTVTIET